MINCAPTSVRISSGSIRGDADGQAQCNPFLRDVWLLVLTSRPMGWIALSSIFFASAWFSGTAGRHPWFVVAMTLVLSFPMCLNGYGLNDAYDLDSDRLNPRRKVRIKSERDRRIVLIGAHISGAAVILISAFSFNLMTIGLTAAIVAASYLYSVPPVRLRQRPPLDSIVNGLGYFLLPALAGWSLGKPFSYLPIDVYLVTAAMASIHAFSSIMDYTPDKQAGHRTFAVAFGKRATALVTTLVMGGVFAALPFWYPGFCTVVSAVIFVNPNERWAKIGTWMMYFGFIVAIITYFIFLGDHFGNPFHRRPAPFISGGH
ncbi:MAG: UbiA family prenyltransferase [Proteobacteria bacterium]|nr:UbiA family prenyltransferase [Pseudomonadota bacterium]